jgi:hypothetical protein
MTSYDTTGMGGRGAPPRRETDLARSTPCQSESRLHNRWELICEGWPEVVS